MKRCVPHPFTVSVKPPGSYRPGFGWVIRKDRLPFRCSEVFHVGAAEALAEARSVLRPLIDAWASEHGLHLDAVASSRDGNPE